ncbi:MAG: hypothetical protein RL187_346 [Actinomycetota bacterium]
MTRYSVDSDEVLTAATHARATIQRINADVATLNSQLLALGGSWSGPAATAFHSVHQSWRNTQVAVEESLGALGVGAPLGTPTPSDLVDLEVHSSHTTGGVTGGCWSGLRLLRDNCLSGEE